MKTNYKLALIILFFILLSHPASPAFAKELSSSELIKNAKEHDGKVITYSGEAIGDVMMRGEFAWVNINDGENALGVWMSSSLAKEIKFTGSYKTFGDKLRITGIFNRACPMHGGDLDIHAQALYKLADGGQVVRKLQQSKKDLSLILLGALFLIWILTLFRRK
jgi:hypothetical protein